MTDYKKRLGTAIATVAILANAYSPLAAYAGTTITINGNGANSDNNVNLDLDSDLNVDQDNASIVV